MASLQQIISWFKEGLFPTEDQFRQTWLSYWHKSEKIPQSQVFGLQETIESATRGLIYQNPVTNVADLYTTYPNAKVGWASMVTSEGYIYSYNGTAWANTGLKEFPEDVATQKDLYHLENDILVLNLLNNDLSGFYTDKRLSSNGGNLISNSSFPAIVSCKPISVLAGTEYVVSGAWYNYNDGIRGLITPDYEALTQHYAPSWIQVSGGWKFTAQITGYLFVDFSLNGSLTALLSPSQISIGNKAEEYVPFGTIKVRDELLPDYSPEFANLQNQITEFENEMLVPGKNLIDPAKIDYTKYYSPGNKAIAARGNVVYVITAYIPVTEGKEYTISPLDGSNGSISYTGGYFTNNTNNNAVDNITFGSPASGSGRTFTVPTGLDIKYVVINLSCISGSSNTLVADFQLESGNAATDYVSYNSKQINPELLPDMDQLKTDVSSLSDNLYSFENLLLIYNSKNMINPANIKFDRRYSTGSKVIVRSDANLIASSGLMALKEGEWYTASGAGICSGWQGGYFGEGATGAIGDAAISNIVFTNPVSGAGKCFQIPIGLGIKYAIVSLATDSDHAQLAGDAQVESGEMATAYEPYNPVEQINPDLLPGGGNTPSPEPTENSELLKYTTFGNLNYPTLSDKIPNFKKHWISKDKNLCVVNSGTSLTARSIEHCTEHSDAKIRPPLMHSNNFATHIWDALQWEGQYYRRYDSGYFTETGSWLTASNIAEWDDGAYRSGLTRYSDDPGSAIAFKVPTGAWQFNFIFRSDSAGSQDCKLNISEGNGMVEVLNEATGQWVEANGFVFSQRESAVTVLPSINYTNPTNGNQATINNYQVKGNTTYQKRLYMRCKSANIDSRSTEKNLIVSRTSGQLLYWGVEWSEREFMITYINAARGSHSSAISTSASCLNHYQDNEIWNFKPDLILSEDPIHNAGGAGVPNTSYPTAYYGRVTNSFFFDEANGVSMKARAATLGLTIPEFVVFNSTITWNFGGIDDNGNLKVGITADGRMWTALDSQSSCFMYCKENRANDVIYINAIKHFVKACYDCYGNMKAATIASGKNGLTFTNEGSHWNDTGCRVMARVVLPILDFTD